VREPSQYGPFSPARRVESERDIERSCVRDDDRRRKAAHQGRGNLGRGHTSTSTWRWPWTIQADGESTVPTTAKGYEGLLSAGWRALAP